MAIKVSDFGMVLFALGVGKHLCSTRGGIVRWFSAKLIDPEIFELTSTRQTLGSDVLSIDSIGSKVWNPCIM